MKTLAYDRFRCTGTNCPVKSRCLRHFALTKTSGATPHRDASADKIIIVATDCDSFIELETQG